MIVTFASAKILAFFTVRSGPPPRTMLFFQKVHGPRRVRQCGVYRFIVDCRTQSSPGQRNQSRIYHRFTTLLFELFHAQSRAQSFSGSLSAVGRLTKSQRNSGLEIVPRAPITRPPDKRKSQ